MIQRIRKEITILFEHFHRLVTVHELLCRWTSVFQQKNYAHCTQIQTAHTHTHPHIDRGRFRVWSIGNVFSTHGRSIETHINMHNEMFFGVRPMTQLTPHTSSDFNLMWSYMIVAFSDIVWNLFSESLLLEIYMNGEKRTHMSGCKLISNQSIKWTRLKHLSNGIRRMQQTQRHNILSTNCTKQQKKKKACDNICIKRRAQQRPELQLPAYWIYNIISKNKKKIDTMHW